MSTLRFLIAGFDLTGASVCVCVCVGGGGGYFLRHVWVGWVEVISLQSEEGMQT